MKFYRKLAAAFVLLMLSLSTQAAVIVVNSTNGGTGGLATCSLADAIIAANTGTTSGGCTAGSIGGDEIIFDSSINGSTILLTADLPTVTDGLMVTGPSGNNQITISGDNAYSIFIADGIKLNLLNLKLVNGQGSSAVTALSYVGNGGAIAAISGAIVTVDKNILSDNNAAFAGGAVIALNSSSVYLNDSVVSNNSANRGGGIAAYYNAGVHLTNTALSGNSGARGGAARAYINSKITVTNNLVSNNSASVIGGAFHITGGSTLKVSGVHIKDNNAMFTGGAIYAGQAGTSVSIFETTFADNKTLSTSSGGVGGGAIMVSWPGSSVNITNSTFTGNSSTNGGAVLVRQGATVSANNVFFFGNRASLSGAAISTENSNVNLERSFLSLNNSEDRGGAIFAEDNAIVNIETSTLYRNKANVRGGGIFIDGGILALTNSTLSGNDSGDEGGAMYANNGASVELNNSTFAENIGGSVFAFNSSDAILRNTVLADGLCSSDFSSNVTLSGGVHIDDGSCGATASGPSQLAPLDYYGGPTRTHLPLPGSPLIDNGVAGSNPTTDQRGYARVIGGLIDIGAVELSDPPMFDTDSFIALIQNLTLGQSIFIDLNSYISDNDSSKFTVTAKGLPSGLRLDISTNVLSGTPKEAGVFETEYTIEDDTGNQIKATVETRVLKSKR